MILTKVGLEANTYIYLLFLQRSGSGEGKAGSFDFDTILSTDSLLTGRTQYTSLWQSRIKPVELLAGTGCNTSFDLRLARFPCLA